MAELVWDDLVGMINGYSVFWETRDVTLSPWDQDPDGGELRLVRALARVAIAAAEADRRAPAGQTGHLSAESIRRMLADDLRRDE